MALIEFEPMLSSHVKADDHQTTVLLEADLLHYAHSEVNPQIHS